MECDVSSLHLPPEEDPHQLEQFAISPLFDIPVTVEGADYEWVSGEGLRVGPHVMPARLTALAPVSLNAENRVRLALHADGGRDDEIVLTWTDEACEEDSPRCRVVGRLEPGDPIVYFDLSERLMGQARRLSLSLPPSSTPLTVRALRGIDQEREGDHGREIVLIGQDVLRPITRSQSVEVASSSTGLQLRIGAADADPFFSLELDAPASEAAFLMLRFEDLPEQTLDLYFSGSECPTIGEACRASFVSGESPGSWLLATHEIPHWRGRIDTVRIDFNGPASEARVKEIRFVTGTEFESLRSGGNPSSQKRLTSGAMGFVVSAGQALECSFPDPSVRRLPEVLRLRVPGGQGVVESLRLQAQWRLADGSSSAAGFALETLAEREARERVLSLSSPVASERPVVRGMRLEVTCDRNCKVSADSSFRIEVEQPTYLRPAPESDGERSLLLVILDTARSDRFTVYCAFRRS